MRRANFFALAPPSDRAGRTFSRTGSCDVATLKPTTPLQPLMQANVKPPSPMLAPEQQPLKPTTPMQAKNAPKTPNSHPQRRCRFQSRLGQHPQRRRRFQTTGPAGLQGQAAAPVCGGGAWPGFETTHRSATRLHWCGGRRRVRRARAGFEIDHSEPQARVWRSRGRAAAHRHTQRPGPTSSARTLRGIATAWHSNRGRHQPTPCASALTHP